MMMTHVEQPTQVLLTDVPSEAPRSQMIQNAEERNLSLEPSNQSLKTEVV